MRLFRICRRAHRALDGEGARLYGGRWNTPGRSAVYTSATLALAALEYLVHVDPDNAPDDLVALTIEIPDDVEVSTANIAALPKDWARIPDHPACRELGDAWLRAGRQLALIVPAAPIPEERNVLLSPGHADAPRVRVIAERAFAFDPRLTH